MATTTAAKSKRRIITREEGGISALNALRAGNANEAPPQPRPVRESEEDVLPVLVDLLYKHGSNCHQWPDWVDRLAERDVSPAAVTPALIRKADALATERLHREQERSRATPRPGTRMPLCDLPAGIAFTLNGHLRGVLLKTIEGGDAKVFVIDDTTGKRETTYWSSGTLVVVAEKKKSENPTSESVNKGDGESAPATANGSMTMKISETNARRILALVWKTEDAESKVKKMTLARVENKLNAFLTNLADGSFTDENLTATADQKLANAIKTTLEAEGKIEVVAADAPTEEAPPKRKGGKAPATPPKKKGGKASAAAESNGHAAGRVKIMGKYSAGAFARWLGINGVGVDDARAIMEANGGCHLSDSSLKWELKERRPNKPAAAVEKSDAVRIKSDFPAAFPGRKKAAAST